MGDVARGPMISLPSAIGDAVPGRRFLLGACAGFALLGLALALLGTAGPFDLYNRLLADALLGRPAPAPEERRLLAFLYGLLGGSIAGKWVAAWFLVREAYGRRRRWAYAALWVGLLVWFVCDSTVSVITGAHFNVLVVNLAPLLVVGVPLVVTRGHFTRASSSASHATEAEPGDAHPPRWRAGWLFSVSLVFVAVGLLLPLAIEHPWFAPYRDRVVTRFLGEGAAAAAGPLLRFGYGLVGATFAAHFAMLALVARYASARGERWAAWAFVASVLTWFTIDSILSLVHGAAFNVIAINLPTLLAVAPPLLAELAGGTVEPDPSSPAR